MCKVTNTDSVFRLLKWAALGPLIKNQIPTAIQEIIKEIYFYCLVLWFILGLLYVVFISLNPIPLLVICTILVSGYFSESLTIKIIIGLKDERTISLCIQIV